MKFIYCPICGEKLNEVNKYIARVNNMSDIYFDNSMRLLGL